jgi:hypothetical protein
MILLAKCSLTSRCRGIGCDIPVIGLEYQSCFAPWRMSNTAEILDGLNQVSSFQGNCNSSTFRTPGIIPPVSSV